MPRLRVLVHRLNQLGEQRRALAAEADALDLERRQLLERVAGAPPADAGRRPLAEWRPAVVRGVLLALGSVLVAVAALIFTAVTWVRLGDLGRAGLLAGATLVAGAAAAAARRHLPATAEALGGLALALLLVDWYALRRAGVVDGVPATTWWALGTGVAAAAAACAGRRLPLQRPAAAILAQVAGLLAVLELAAAPWTVATGLALLASASTALAARLTRVAGWHRAVVALLTGAALLELAAVLGLILQTPPVDDLTSATGPAVALATLALAPAIARATIEATATPTAGRRVPSGAGAAFTPTAGRRVPWGSRAGFTRTAGWRVPRWGSVTDPGEGLPGGVHSPTDPAGHHPADPAIPTGNRPAAAGGVAAGHWLVAASAGALLGAAGTLLAAAWSGWSLAAAVAVVGAAVVAVGRFLPWSLQPGATLAAGGMLVVGLVGLADPVLWALVGPAGWLGDPWSARFGDPAPGALVRLWRVDGGPGGGWPAVVGLLAAAGAVLAAGPGRRSPAGALPRPPPRRPPARREQRAADPSPSRWPGVARPCCSWPWVGRSPPGRARSGSWGRWRLAPWVGLVARGVAGCGGGGRWSRPGRWLGWGRPWWPRTAGAPRRPSSR